MKTISGLVFFLLLSFSLETTGQENIPELNRKILNYVDKVIGTKVDRGECWDLAYQALTQNHAQWDGKFVYGKEVNPLKDIIYPGDLIQFYKVKIKYTIGNTVTTEVMEQHTAIVYKVLGKGIFQLAHQNTDFSGKKVGLSEMNIGNVVKGKLKFYRPIPENNR
jgi:hypothetical protein